MELKQRLGLLRRIKQRILVKKLILVAEAIFNSKIRYGIAVYLKPMYEKEELKGGILSENTSKLQTLQNKMIRSILGMNINDHVNLKKIRSI